MRWLQSIILALVLTLVVAGDSFAQAEFNELYHPVHSAVLHCAAGDYFGILYLSNAIEQSGAPDAVRVIRKDGEQALLILQWGEDREDSDSVPSHATLYAGGKTVDVTEWAQDPHTTLCGLMEKYLPISATASL